MALTQHAPDQQASRQLLFWLGAMTGLYAFGLMVGGASDASSLLGGIGSTLSVVSILGAGLVLSRFVVEKWRHPPAQIPARVISRRRRF